MVNRLQMGGRLDRGLLRIVLKIWKDRSPDSQRHGIRQIRARAARLGFRSDGGSRRHIAGSNRVMPKWIGGIAFISNSNLRDRWRRFGDRLLRIRGQLRYAKRNANCHRQRGQTKSHFDIQFLEKKSREKSDGPFNTPARYVVLLALGRVGHAECAKVW